MNSRQLFFKEFQMDGIPSITVFIFEMLQLVQIIQVSDFGWYKLFEILLFNDAEGRYTAATGALYLTLNRYLQIPMKDLNDAKVKGCLFGKSGRYTSQPPWLPISS